MNKENINYINQNDCFYYKNKYYSIGTKVLYKNQYNNIFKGTVCSVNPVIKIKFNGFEQTFDKKYIEKYIIEIVDPIEINLVEANNMDDDKICPSGDGLFYGTLWYILIIFIGTIFKDRVGIWLFATVVFIIWKNGYLKGRK